MNTKSDRQHRKRVLILMADFGYGHRSAANALAEALRETHGQDCVVEIINPLDDERALAFFQNDQANYDKLVREMPELYKLGYQVSDSTVASSLIESAMTLLLFNVLREIIQQHQPDVIVCAYPIYPAILSEIFKLEKRRVPIVTIVTDWASYTSCGFIRPQILYLVPTKTVYDLAVEAAFLPKK